ncbi:hypothetical protein [Clostridioides sp. ZZV15-6598]|uniref:hypothetical protein n=1 Tax=Clostridioides sp. ZZV15-6598 TaxID=2811501 RepID=UPI001D0FDDA5|nr:hypothetical protein [Clostridioides sp. ZZV15-6598]
MYCKNCDLEFDDTTTICPKCNHILTSHRQDLSQISMKSKVDEFKLNKKIRNGNILTNIIILTLIIHIILILFMQIHIEDYYDIYIKYCPTAISGLVLVLSLKRGEKRHKFLSNLLFISIMILISIFGTIYYSAPLVNRIFNGNYLFKEYWTVYGVGNFIIILECILIIFDDSYYLAHINKKSTSDE